jgi:hypothetical protein
MNRILLVFAMAATIVSAKAATYRPSVQTFDKVMREAPAPQAP